MMTSYIDLHSLAQDDEVARLRVQLLGLRGLLVPSESRSLLLTHIQAGDSIQAHPKDFPYWRKLPNTAAIVSALDGTEDDKPRIDRWLEWALVLHGLSPAHAKRLADTPPGRGALYPLYMRARSVAEGFANRSPRPLPELEEVGPPIQEALSVAEPYSWKVYQEGDRQDLLAHIGAARTSGELIGLDVETDVLGKRPSGLRDTLVGVAIAFEKEVYYIERALLSVLQEGLRRSDRWAGHSSKYDLALLRRAGVSIGSPSGDGMLAAYLLGSQEAGLKGLVYARYGHRLRTYAEVTRGGRISDIPIDEVGAYCSADAWWGRRLASDLRGELSPELSRIYEEVDLPLVEVLVDMELEGIGFDEKGAERTLAGTRGQLVGLDGAIDELARRDGYVRPSVRKVCKACRGGKRKRLGCEECQGEGGELITPPANPGSPSQLVEWFHGTKGLPVQGLSSRTGRPSLNSLALLKLSKLDPAPNLILLRRKLKKYEEFLEDWLKESNEGRIHSTFTNSFVVSGRLSSRDPNLQQVSLPWRGHFREEAPWILVAADYHSLEMRTAAFVSRDPLMMEILNRDPSTFEGDMHAQTMLRVFGIPYKRQKEYPGMRVAAKAFNFGSLYLGKEDTIISLIEKQALENPELDVPIPSQQEARELLRRLHRTYAGYFYEAVPFMIQKAKKWGGVAYTAFGRPLYLPGLFSKDEKEREAAERKCVNHVAGQGTAADIARRAMLQVKGIPHGRQLVQVHDEILVRVEEEKVVWYTGIIKEAMELGQPLEGVPLVVNVGVGRTWREAHK